MIIADTNVVSELMRPAPAPVVVEWVRRWPPRQVCTTAITLAEIQYGIERMPDGRRKAEVRAVAEEVVGMFTAQVLAFDADAAAHYAVIVDKRDRLGRPIDVSDAQIAAICVKHGAALATRNIKDFLDTGVKILDPWQDS